MIQRLFSIEIRFESDVVLARQKARALAAALQFDSQDQARIATAVSEVARNAFQYAGGGRAEFALMDMPQTMLTVTFRGNNGKGIPDLEEILEGQHPVQGDTLGILGAKRLMDYFHIDYDESRKATVILGKPVPARRSRITGSELVSLLSSIDRVSQNPYEELMTQNKELLAALQELRARQEELAQLNRELDETNRGVVALYAELNDKADVVQRASELKSHFFSNMSHEFKTPLSSITALSQILLDRLDGDLTPEQEKQVRFINRSAQDLGDLVNDLLDLAKVEAGRVNIRPATFQVSSLFAALRGMLRPLVNQNSSVNLVIEEAAADIPELFSDEAKVSQILRNFISNALKFTERGEIRVSAKRGEDNTVSFSVSDTGIGIAAADQERIFEEWTQLEGKMQRAAKGSGLGLPLSRKFAQLLGGDVYVKSELGKGSTFYAVIPIAFAGATEALYVPDVKRQLDVDKLPVLVVEDNNEALFIYEKYLTGTQFQLIPARNLKEARKALQEFRPVAVILDVLLQGEQSWDLLHELKHTQATEDIPILVVTVVENRNKALAMGADGFHSKPVERSWLVEKLKAVADHHNATDVLIIDDDEVSRYVLRTLLGQMDFQFTEACSGQEGLKKVAQQKPNVVILDLSMPDVSGFEVLSLLKADSETAEIPVIIYTSADLTSRETDSLRDAVAVVSKQSRSREISLENFAEAFRKAGFPMKVRPAIGENQHV
jgi:signal transduction histidine kinase/CheY-like chemotaxis protein